MELMTTVLTSDLGAPVRQHVFGGPRVLPAKLNAFVEAVYERPRARGLPIKSALAGEFPDVLNERGCFRVDLDIQKFTCKELGIPEMLYNFFEGGEVCGDPKKLANLNCKVNRMPKAYGPKKGDQTRGSNGQFGGARKGSADDGAFLRPEDTVCHPFRFKAAILFALKQKTVTAKELGMERVGSMWKSLNSSNGSVGTYATTRGMGRTHARRTRKANRFLQEHCYDRQSPGKTGN